MSRRIEEALAACLRAREEGPASLEHCLNQFPEQRAELDALLRTADSLRTLRQIRAPERLRHTPPLFAQPSPARLAPARHRLLRLLPSPALLRRRAVRVGLSAAAAFLLALGGLGYTVSISVDSTPNQPLYRVRLAWEGARVALASNPAQRAIVHLAIADRHFEQVSALCQSGDEQALAEVTAVYLQHLEGAKQALRQVEAENDAAAVSLAHRLRSDIGGNTFSLRRSCSRVPEAQREALARALAGTRNAMGLFLAVETLPRPEREALEAQPTPTPPRPTLVPTPIVIEPSNVASMPEGAGLKTEHGVFPLPDG